MCVPDANEGQKKLLHILELELETDVSCHMCAFSSQPLSQLSSPVVFLLKEENWGMETVVFLTSHSEW